MKSCTKDEIRKKWKELKKNPDLIYSDGKTIFNYIGRLKDAPDTPCIDYIAKLILEDFIILEKIGTNVDDCRHSKFFNMNHDGTSNPKKRIEKHGEITFNENQFGMALYNSCHSFSFGKIFDYQLSLNQKKSSKCGKIDLLSKINNEIYVIELKVPYTNPKKKTETLLRAIIESFTFTKLLSIQKDKFIKDMKDMKHMKLSEKINFDLLF